MPLPYKMKDLCALTGLPRQAIHFYIHEGLVPEGEKTGRNMAFYGDAHVARIRLIRRLQEERFLPLKAIRAVLEEEDGAFSAPQRRMLSELKQRLAPALAGGRVERGAPGEVPWVDARPLLAEAGLDRRDLTEMSRAGLLAVRRGPKGQLRIARDDAWMITLFGEVRALGFTRELGFSAEVLGIFEEAVSRLFEREKALLLERLSHLPPDRVAAMVERILPLVTTFLVRYHETKVREFFVSV